jgi:hypothetical protein
MSPRFGEPSEFGLLDAASCPGTSFAAATIDGGIEYVDIRLNTSMYVHQVRLWWTTGGNPAIKVLQPKADGGWQAIFDATVGPRAGEVWEPGESSCRGLEGHGCVADIDVCRWRYPSDTIRIVFDTSSPGWECLEGIRVMGSASLPRYIVSDDLGRVVYWPNRDSNEPDSFAVEVRDCYTADCIPVGTSDSAELASGSRGVVHISITPNDDLPVTLESTCTVAVPTYKLCIWHT